MKKIKQALILICFGLLATLPSCELNDEGDMGLKKAGELALLGGFDDDGTELDLLREATTARPLFQLPFPCGETWSASTYTTHNPQKAVDLNWGSTANADLGKPVVASASGTVVVSKYSPATESGYGNYIVIDHGGGWKSYYCHLDVRSVSVGAWVSRGQKIGTVGNTSAKYTIYAHLHYEQRLDGVCQYIYFNGSQIYYWGKSSITSKNCSTATGTVNTSGTALNVRSGPGTSYSIVGTVADGQKVTIYCQTYGTTVTGTYGTSNVWDYIGWGYIADAYVYTGSDGLVAPLCK